jgi:hypothetical protein
MDINDQFYAGTKGRRRKFEDETHSEEILVERELVVTVLRQSMKMVAEEVK